jgi:hypothetical protein
MKTAKFVKEIMVKDPDTSENIPLSIFKHENNGMFGIDSSYIEQCFDDYDDIKIQDPFYEAPDSSLRRDDDTNNLVSLTGV